MSSKDKSDIENLEKLLRGELMMNSMRGPASGQEAERRLKRVSDMRDFLITTRRSMANAWRSDKLPTKPAYDIRSDAEHWKNLAKE